MQRKAIQLAGKTLVVSLPSKWVRKNNVKKGDELEITEEDKRIIVSTEKEIETKKATIDTEKIGEYDPLYIAYLYQAGIDEIRFDYKDREVFQKIQEKTAHLMGYEIIGQGEHYAEVKNVSSALDTEFDTILRRTFYILEDMGKSSLEAIQNKNIERLKDILELENSIDKFTDFCKRMLTKKGHKDPQKTQFYYVIVRDMEKIGDYYEDIILNIIETELDLSPETENLYNEANEFLALFHKLFYKFSKEEASKFQKKKKELKINTNNIMKNTKKEELFVVYSLSGLIKMIANLYGPYFITTI